MILTTFQDHTLKNTCIIMIIYTKCQVKVSFALMLLVEVLPVEKPPVSTYAYTRRKGSQQSQMPFLNKSCQVKVFWSYLRFQMQIKCKVSEFRGEITQKDVFSLKCIFFIGFLYNIYCSFTRKQKCCFSKKVVPGRVNRVTFINKKTSHYTLRRTVL